MRDWAEAIQELRQNHGLDILLELNGMARSTCYYHEKHLGTSDGYDELRERIGKIYTKHHKRYGYRRIT